MRLRREVFFLFFFFAWQPPIERTSVVASNVAEAEAGVRGLDTHEKKKKKKKGKKDGKTEHACMHKKRGVRWQQSKLAGPNLFRGLRGDLRYQTIAEKKGLDKIITLDSRSGWLAGSGIESAAVSNSFLLFLVSSPCDICALSSF